ncbi:hypothetical protein B9Z55_021842 [Caenorhabditis nigoni]|uniref:Uncharacterized protein n=1 Tax=Caenorhabditis nigoni TaxID=1611254 RepID=A0A2G5TTP1_9PELO|nr:hypothetical protein B9Z55_021842 [Caenorhabditis nigoni]
MRPRSAMNPRQTKEPKKPEEPKELKEPEKPKEPEQPNKNLVQNLEKDDWETDARQRTAWDPKRLDYLADRAKALTIKVDNVIHPVLVYADKGPLIIHLCYECRAFNAMRKTKNVGSGKVDLPLGMCTICRTHMNRARALLFHGHEVPIVKKQYSF